jgi:adenylate kinase
MIYFSILLWVIMLIGLTGTPGCGKTKVATILKDRGYSVVSLNLMAKEEDCVTSYDKPRNSYEVDLEKLDEIVNRKYSDSDLIIEGHLSHFLSVDRVIILRCDPFVLKNRLDSRGWSKSKIKENVDAEILDVIKVEAHEEDQAIFEIDTSRKTPEEVVESIQNIIKGEYQDPKVDWLSKYEHILFKSP